MSRRGIVLWETLILVAFFFLFAMGMQIAIYRRWSTKLKELESTRLRYDGGKVWSD